MTSAPQATQIHERLQQEAEEERVKELAAADHVRALAEEVTPAALSRFKRWLRR